MTVKRKLEYNNVIYFITFSCYNWLQLFELAGYDIAYNWFKKLIEKRIGIIGFVIMPNHIHAKSYSCDILFARESWNRESNSC